MIDVKTLDPSGDTHRVVSHTDSERLAAHARVERDCARDEYGPLPPRLRLLVLTVSVFGSFGRPTHACFAELSRRTGGAVPPPLLPSATWAAPRLAPRSRGWRSPRRCAAGLPPRCGRGGRARQRTLPRLRTPCRISTVA